MINSVLTTGLLLVMLAGCAPQSVTGLGPSKSASTSGSAAMDGGTASDYQPSAATDVSTTSDTQPSATADRSAASDTQPSATADRSAASDAQPSKTSEDLHAIIQELGTPVPFDKVFEEVQIVPRFKDEFETTAQFKQRQADARAKGKERYLIATPVDPEHIRYDADKHVLVVTVWALNNRYTTDGDLDSLFGWFSELEKAGIDIKHGPSPYTNNVEWPFPPDSRNVGTHEGQNAFGVRTTIIKQEITKKGIFERQGARGEVLESEDVWFRSPPKNVELLMRAAFEIKADPDRARLLKQSGALRAGVLVAPRFPFYATGVVQDTPTIQSPFDVTTNLRYLIGDIQAVALYDSSGQLIGVRATR